MSKPLLNLNDPAKERSHGQPLLRGDAGRHHLAGVVEFGIDGRTQLVPLRDAGGYAG
jgi:hypothetical protein